MNEISFSNVMRPVYVFISTTDYDSGECLIKPVDISEIEPLVMGVYGTDEKMPVGDMSVGDVLVDLDHMGVYIMRIA